MKRFPWLIFGILLLVALFVALGCASVDAPDVRQSRDLLPRAAATPPGYSCFSSSGPAVIPTDGWPVPSYYTITVGGVNTNVADSWVSLSITTTETGYLQIYLVDPDNQYHNVWYYNNGTNMVDAAFGSSGVVQEDYEPSSPWTSPPTYLFTEWFDDYLPESTYCDNTFNDFCDLDPLLDGHAPSCSSPRQSTANGNWQLAITDAGGEGEITLGEWMICLQTQVETCDDSTPTPTPTRTPTATPTMQASNAGMHVYDQTEWAAYSSDCAALATARAPETWTKWTDAVFQNPIDTLKLYICNLSGSAKTCTVNSDWFVQGYSAAFTGVFGCYGLSSWCLAPNNVRYLLSSTYTQPCTVLGYPAGGSYVGAYTNTLSINTWGTPAVNGAMEISLTGGGLAGAGCTSAGSYMQASVYCGPSPTPSPTTSPSPTITPTPTQTLTPSTTPTASLTPSITPTSVPGITPTATGCAYRYCASNSASTPVASALVAVSQDRQGTDIIRSALTGADACRNFYLPGGMTYFFPQKSQETFTNPDARAVPTPIYSTCGWQYCVVDASATPQPITDAVIAVSTTKTGTNHIQTGRTDATGCVVFVDIPPGNYYIFRSSPTFSFATNPDEEAIP